MPNDSDTIRFTNGVFTAHVTTAGEAVMKYEDETGTVVTFVNEYDQDQFRGFYGKGGQTCKGKIIIASTPPKRNVGFCVAYDSLNLEGEIVCSNIHATAENIDNQGPPVGGQG